MDQINLLENLVEFNDNSRPRTIEGKDKKTDTDESAYTLYGCCELTPNALKSGIFLIKGTQGKVRPSDLATRLKILTPKQILQRLPIALAQVKAGNTSENSLNEMRQSYILCIEQNKPL